jgi:hypothetical protein
MIVLLHAYHLLSSALSLCLRSLLDLPDCCCLLRCSMIVLLHAYHLGFTAWQTAVMFTLYEVAGVVTNLLAGLMGARWGIKSTLLTGRQCTAGDVRVAFLYYEDITTYWIGTSNEPAGGAHGGALGHQVHASHRCCRRCCGARPSWVQ